MDTVMTKTKELSQESTAMEEMQMNELNLIIRPTFEVLTEDCNAEELEWMADDEEIYNDQSTRVCIHEGERFEVPEGCEATPDGCECFLAGEKDDVVFCAERNGMWIDPEGIQVLSAGRYLYKGDGVIQHLG